MKVAIIGFGVEGRGILPYWQAKGAQITVCKRTAEPLPAGIEGRFGEHYLDNLDEFDVIVRSPVVHPHKILQKNPGVGAKITTAIDEFMRACPTKHVIGVTGTKGKGTTSVLIIEMLTAAGKKAYLGGNYGISPFDFLDKLTADSWVVLELSSYTLYDATRSPHIGVCLMVQPEHLDWHGTEQDYYRSKANLFAHQQPDDIAIYYADDITSHKIASTSPGDKIAYYDEPGAYIHDGNIMIDQTILCKTSDLKLLGQHNWQNVCAAVTAVWQVVQAPDAIRNVLVSFTGLPHRLEFVRKVGGVRYYNDSFASDPYATQAAMAAVPGTKVLIVGGYERMLPLEDFARAVAADTSVRTVLLIGQSAARVAEAFQHAGFNNFHISTAKAMPAIVAEARGLAKPGDAVVLSPGFASFDMFKNFEVRGQAFKETAHAL